MQLPLGQRRENSKTENVRDSNLRFSVTLPPITFADGAQRKVTKNLQSFYLYSISERRSHSQFYSKSLVGIACNVFNLFLKENSSLRQKDEVFLLEA